MEITPFILLIIYLVGVIIIVLISLLNVYHILRFGFLRAPSIIITFSHIILLVGIVLLTLRILGHIDWNQPIDISIPFIGDGNEGFE